MSYRAALLALLIATPAAGAPFHDPIPQEFRGTFAPTAQACGSPDGVDLIEVSSDGIHYYEGDDYLIIGISFTGSSTKSGKMIPLFNGRFTGRLEAQLLGEVNARLEMETANLLLRYAFDNEGEPNPKPINTWAGAQFGQRLNRFG